MISMKSARVTLAATVLAFCLTPFTPAVSAEKWDFYVYNAVSTVAAVKGLNTVIEQIDKETAGELTIRLHLGGSLPINTTTITQAVSDDVVQMGYDGYFLGNVPIGGVLRLPMLIRTLEEYRKAAAIMAPYLEKAFEKKGIIVLGQYLYPFQVGFSSKKLTSLADIKGQKIRVTSPEQGEFIKRLGGIPVVAHIAGEADLVRDLVAAAAHERVRAHVRRQPRQGRRGALVVGEVAEGLLVAGIVGLAAAELLTVRLERRHGAAALRRARDVGRDVRDLLPAQAAPEGRHAAAAGRDLAGHDAVARLQLVEVGSRLAVGFRGGEGVAPSAPGRGEDLPAGRAALPAAAVAAATGEQDRHRDGGEKRATHG